MPATTGYTAAIETNATQLSYAVETAFCGGNVNAPTAPAVAFKAIRYMSDTLAGTKSRQRPQEINPTREASTAVTVSEQAAGAINGALSFNTYDDWFASSLNNLWPTPIAITGAAGDIALAGAGPTYTLTSGAGKWTGITVGMWIKLLGFAASGGINNNVYKVTAVTSTVLTVIAPFHTPVPETPTLAAAQVRACSITNGTTFTSLFIQQALSSTMYLRYPGAYITGFQVGGQVGQFCTSNFNVLATQELNSATNASTGGVVAAPSGVVMNCVGNFLGVTWGTTQIVGTVDQFQISVNNANAAAQYGLGSSAAAGVLSGTLEVTGSLRMFFNSFTYYTNFKTETFGPLSIVTRDNIGQTYVFTLPNATLMNPKVDAGGPGQSVMASFDIEGNPQSTGGTIQIDRLVAV